MAYAKCAEQGAECLRREHHGFAALGVLGKVLSTLCKLRKLFLVIY